MGGVTINAESELTNSREKDNSLSENGTDNENLKKRNLGLTQKGRDKRNKKTFDCMQQSFKDNRDLFLKINEKVVNNYKVTLRLYIISFAFGLGLLTVTFILTFLGTIPTLNSLIGGAAGLIELYLVMVFKPIEKIHEIISDYAQISIITSSYQEQVGLRLVQMSVKDRDSLGVAANEINLAAKNASDMIQTYCEVKADSGQSKMLKEVMQKIQDFFKKKDKDAADKK